ncbi:MAG: cytochrome c [Desulfovibrionaceae bacterium]
MRKLIAFSSLALLLATLLAVPTFADESMGAKLFKTCANCHGADGATSAKAGGTTLKGQAADVLEKKLLGYQDGTYGGLKAMIMKNMVKKLSSEEIKALATFIAGF